MTIRAAAAALLERHRSVPPPPNGLLPQGGSVPPPRAVSATHTIRVETDDAPHSQKPTRVVGAVWGEEKQVA